MTKGSVPKKVYHYTKLESFLKIWETKSLLFSDVKPLNDIFERNKIITVDKATLPVIGKPKTELELVEIFMRQFYKTLNNYRQISLTIGQETMIPRGYDIPMMWGQYARWRKNKRSKWQDGVCIELNTDMLDLENPSFYCRKVTYTNRIHQVSFDGYNFVKNSIETFIDAHLKDLFFVKHSSWKAEKEFRIVTNDTQFKFLSIEGAISGIYVPNYDSETMAAVEDAVKEDRLLFFFINSYAKNVRRLSRYNVHEFREFEKGKKHFPFSY